MPTITIPVTEEEKFILRDRATRDRCQTLSEYVRKTLNIPPFKRNNKPQDVEEKGANDDQS